MTVSSTYQIFKKNWRVERPFFANRAEGKIFREFKKKRFLSPEAIEPKRYLYIVEALKLKKNF